MKRFNYNFFIMALAMLSAPLVNAQSAPQWKIDKSHASVNFSVDHFFSAVTGKFKNFDGAFYFDQEDLSSSTFSFTIQVASVNTDEPDRDEHLQSADFFNAKKWPTMKFVSTSVEKKGKDNFVLHGNLTIRDKTQKVALPMQITGVMDNPWNAEKVIMGIKISTVIDRTQYGVGTGSWAATAVVGDEVQITINMELDGEKQSL